jgi:hypothetical protein
MIMDIMELVVNRSSGRKGVEGMPSHLSTSSSIKGASLNKSNTQ